jgi:cell division protein FtsI (penicillin-binding protein 3)
MQKTSSTRSQNRTKIAVLAVLVAFAFVVFVAILLFWSGGVRDLPNFKASDTKTAVRGLILSSDGYTLATTKLVYEASVDTRNIDPDKRELFIELYTIYTGASESSVRAKIKKSGRVTLSYALDAKQAAHLRSLAKMLYRLGVFRSFIDPKSERVIFNGLDVVESGETRIYPYKDLLEPVLGYTNKDMDERVVRRRGIKGLERSYDERLSSRQDSYLVGPRDISNAIILNRNSKAREAIDGESVQLSIPIKFQKSVEHMLDLQKQRLGAKEILAVVMNSRTGDIVSLATSNRYERGNVTDISRMNIAAVEYSYEPGSVMKPLIYALLLREGKITPHTIVNGHGGRWKLGNFWITDEHQMNWTSAENVIIHSSNIGIAQLAQELTTLEYSAGLKDLGFAQRSGIDLGAENPGYIENLNGETYKGTVAYGYGLHANFMQLMRAFNIFNNGGELITPRLVAYIIDKHGRRHDTGHESPTQAVPREVADSVKNTLIKTVTAGTGAKANVSGLIVGGKTGTAEIKRGGNKSGYNSSFIGFANDAAQGAYTIGVLVIEPTKSYFGAQSAAPIFKQIVEEMVEEGWLVKSTV